MRIIMVSLLFLVGCSSANHTPRYYDPNYKQHNKEYKRDYSMPKKQGYLFIVFIGSFTAMAVNFSKTDVD